MLSLLPSISVSMELSGVPFSIILHDQISACLLVNFDCLKWRVLKGGFPHTPFVKLYFMRINLDKAFLFRKIEEYFQSFIAVIGFL